MSLHPMFTNTPHGRLLNTRIGEPSLSPPDPPEYPEREVEAYIGEKCRKVGWIRDKIIADDNVDWDALAVAVASRDGSKILAVFDAAIDRIATDEYMEVELPSLIAEAQIARGEACRYDQHHQTARRPERIQRPQSRPQAIAQAGHSAGIRCVAVGCAAYSSQ